MTGGRFHSLSASLSGVRRNPTISHHAIIYGRTHSLSDSESECHHSELLDLNFLFLLGREGWANRARFLLVLGSFLVVPFALLSFRGRFVVVVIIMVINIIVRFIIRLGLLRWLFRITGVALGKKHFYHVRSRVQPERAHSAWPVEVAFS
jgi:hypothetical protein